MKRLLALLAAVITVCFCTCACAEELARAEVTVAGELRVLTLTGMETDNGNLNLYFTGFGNAFSPEDWMAVITVDGARLESWAAFPGEGLTTFIFDTDRIPGQILLISPEGEEIVLWP